MRIGIDGRLAGIRHAGIGRYITELMRRLPTLGPDIEWVFFFFDKTQIHEVLGTKTPKNVLIVLAPIPHYSLKEQWQWPALLRQSKLDVLHVPHFNVPLWYSGPVVVTIHDLLWHEYRGADVTTLSPWKYWLKYFGYKIITSQAIFKALRIFVPAETIRHTVHHYYPMADEKVVVTKEGVAASLASTKTSHSPNLTDEKRGKRTIVYVGSLYPHKNIEVVIKALTKMPDVKLQLIGSRSVFQKRVQAQVAEHQVGNQVEFLGYVADAKMQEYLSQAVALVQPSLSEGFGLTGLEALASGVPVIASDIPIFHEIYQDAAHYFDPKSPSSFISAFQKCEKQNYTKFAATAKKVVAQYSWDTMAQRTLDEYRSAIQAYYAH